MTALWPTKKSINDAKEFLLNQRGFGFLDGGCLIFAHAISLLEKEPTKPKTKIATLMIKNKPDHYGLIIDSKFWADARAIHQNKYLWAQNYTIQEKISGKAEIIDHYIPSDSIPSDLSLSEKISKMLVLKEQSLILDKYGDNISCEREI